jgi:hypothetical protein
MLGGGLYFDVDVEVIRDFDDIIEHGSYMGFERIDYVCPGCGIGFEPLHPVLLEMMEIYKTYCDLDMTDRYNNLYDGDIASFVLRRHGLRFEAGIQNISGVRVYPIEYFAPKSCETGITTLTRNTHSIHHFEGSWLSEKDRRGLRLRWEFYKKYWGDEAIMTPYKRMRESFDYRGEDRIRKLKRLELISYR